MIPKKAIDPELLERFSILLREQKEPAAIKQALSISNNDYIRYLSEYIKVMKAATKVNKVLYKTPREEQAADTWEKINILIQCYQNTSKMEDRIHFERHIDHLAEYYASYLVHP